MNMGPQQVAPKHISALEFEPFTINDLLQIGIFSLCAEKSEAGKDALVRYVAELYVEKMAINLQNA